MNEHERTVLRREWRRRMEGTANPPSPATDAPNISSAAETGFISSSELDDLYDLYTLTQQENEWPIEPREQFEARYREEIAARNNRVSER